MLGPSVDHHDDGRRFVQGEARLAKDLGGNKILVLRHNAAGIDHAETASQPVGSA